LRNFGGLTFSAYGKQLVLPIARHYKHVGSTTRTDGRMCTDVAVKASCIKTAANGLRKHVLGNPGIPVDVKLGVAQTHVFPVGEYSCGGWGPLTKPEFDCYARAVVDVYRIVDGSVRKPPAACGQYYVFKTDAKVVSGLEVLSPMARLAVARVRIFALMLSRGQTFLLALAYEGRMSSKSWWKALVADLEWLAAGSSKLSEFRLSGVGGWLTFLCGNGPRAMCTVQAAASECCRKQEAELQAIADAGGAEAIEHLADGDAWQCTECGESLGSYQAMVAHRARSHGILRDARRKIAGATCPVCLRTFAHRSGVLNHLHKRSAICLMNLESYYQDLGQEEVAAADAKQLAAEQACRARKEAYCYTDTLCVQSEGPLWPFVIPNGHSRRSTYGKFRRMLKCRRSCREVSFEALRSLLAGRAEDVDDIPRDILEAAW
jgi:hypothetical protein